MTTINPERRGWHIDKSINPSYAVPLVMAILSVMAWAGSTNSQQAVQDQKISFVESKVEENSRLSREDLKEINRKLDKLIAGTNATK